MMNRIWIAAMLLITRPCFADDAAGKTANGCTYQVINGQYLYNCEHANPSDSSPAKVAPAPEKKPEKKVVEDYASIPVRKSANPAPSISVVPVVIPRAQAKIPVKEEGEESSEEAQNFRRAPYVGLLAASTTLAESASGSALGMGLSLGANLSSFWAAELSYAYTSQNLNLGLASRAGAASSVVTASDASLRAQLLSAEAQFHLLDSNHDFRPFFGLGLGWKQSSLVDKSDASTTLSQSSLGAIPSLGFKFRFSETLQGLLSFRYFLPLASGEASVLESSNSRLQSADDRLTSSKLYQLVGGLQYIF